MEKILMIKLNSCCVVQIGEEKKKLVSSLCLTLWCRTLNARISFKQ